ncbi:unnamed protein product [Heterosigma akashiwo]|mmetsp:Transcript_10864/g.15188  ORF Transcript_10864/g.15188 Transcript_10864/m.15188 type:complete len:420 (-) Transcript_10864:176-1435(-)
MAASIPLHRVEGDDVEFALNWEFVDGRKVDLDAQAVLFDGAARVVDAAFYNQLEACEGSVKHSGDNRDGEGQDDEIIKVDFDALPSQIQAMAIVVTAYSGGSFQSVRAAKVQVRGVHKGAAYSGDKQSILTEASVGCQGQNTALVFCVIFKGKDGEWCLRKVDKKTSGKHFQDCLSDVRAVVDLVLDPKAVGDRVLSTEKTFNMSKGDVAEIPEEMIVSSGQLRVGLGWTTQKQDLDLDASCLMLTDDYSCSQEWVVYFGQQSLPGVQHSGDNMTGEGSGDDETMVITLDQVPPQIQHLVFTVNIYSDGRTFAEVSNSYVRMLAPEGQVLARYDLGPGVRSRGLFFACFSRAGGGWSFRAVGEQVDGKRGKDRECFEDVRAVMTTGQASTRALHQFGGGGGGGGTAPQASSSGGCCVVS